MDRLFLLPANMVLSPLFPILGIALLCAAMPAVAFFLCRRLDLSCRGLPKLPPAPAEAADYFFPDRSRTPEPPPKAPPAAPSRRPLALTGKWIGIVSCFLPLLGFFGGLIAVWIGDWCRKKADCRYDSRRAIVFGLAAILQSVWIFLLAAYGA